MRNLLSLVDVDGLLYYAGYAGEERHYDVVLEDKDGNVSSRSFDKAADIKSYLESNDGYTVIDRDLVVTPLDVSFALKVIKNKLTEIQSRYGKTMRVYVKGNGVNYRDELYKVQKYKGNRKTVKPYHYDSMVEYLMQQWDAIKVDGKEVDDQVALDAYEASKPVVICSPDKDLDQIPGLHWNYVKAVQYEVDPQEAEMFFWEQMLSGDNADNILGVWKIGPEKARRMVAEFYDDGLLQEEIWERVLSEYERSKEMPSCPYKEMDTYETAVQTGIALWMQNKRNVLWTPPGEGDRYMDIEEEDDWS